MSGLYNLKEQTEQTVLNSNHFLKKVRLSQAFVTYIEISRCQGQMKTCNTFFVPAGGT